MATAETVLTDPTRLLARYFLQQAQLCQRDLREGPEGPRFDGDGAAKALQRLAAHILELPRHDECCRELMQCSLKSGRFLPAPDGRVTRAVHEFRTTEPVDCAGFLRSLPRRAAADLVEFGMDLGVFDA